MFHGQGHFVGYVRMGSHGMSRSMSMGIEDIGTSRDVDMSMSTNMST